MKAADVKMKMTAKNKKEGIVMKSVRVKMNKLD
jgi:hypothetical protein